MSRCHYWPIFLAMWLGLSVGLLPGCREEPSLVGHWRDQSPAALLYDFRDDGSVWLVEGSLSLPVFRFAVKEGGVLELYDGMGRRRELLFEVSDERLLLRELDNPAVIFGEYERRP